MPRFRHKLLIYSLLFILQSTATQLAAQTLRIRIVSAGLMAHSTNLPEFVRVTGNPVFEHDGAYLYCDSAWFNEVQNNVDCYGHVRIKSSDTLNLYGNVLNYNGNTKTAIVRENVRLVDKQTTLTTDYMVFDRNTGIASYTTGGRMVNGDNVMTSKRCYYYTSKKLMYFRDDVVLTNPDYKINCDTLKYNTVSRKSFFLGPTIMKSDDSYLYCENGEYDRANSLSKFSVNALLVDDNRRLTGDSLYYNEKLKFGKAVNNIVMTDTIQNVIIKGNYAEYWRKRGYSLVSDRPVAIMGDSKDTLYIHADTLKATFDTVRNETRELFGYHNTRFYRTDIQGISDSLHYSFADSLISLYYKPTLWSGENQLTADTILIQTGKNSIRKIYMQNAAFIASKDTIANFNQIKGKNMIGHFADNELVSIDVNGNSETIYYVREEDKALIGINKAAGSRMRLYIKDSKIKRIVYFDKPTGNMFPDKDMKSDERLLKGFSWRGEARPINKEDIFRKSGVSAVLTPEKATE